MQIATTPAGLAVGAIAVFASIGSFVLAVRVGRCNPIAARGHYGVALLALVIAALVLLRMVSPVIAYGLVCLVLVGGKLVGVVREACAHRRRVASLTPRPAADVLSTLWVVIVLASVLILVPYLGPPAQRSAAVLVGVCVIIMAGIAWHIASAPLQLHGEDIPSERLRDHVLRCRSVGYSAVLAIGSLFVFVSFVNAALPTIDAWQRIALHVSFFTWAGVWAWVEVSAYWLGRRSRSAT